MKSVGIALAVLLTILAAVEAKPGKVPTAPSPATTFNDVVIVGRLACETINAVAAYPWAWVGLALCEDAQRVLNCGGMHEVRWQLGGGFVDDPLWSCELCGDCPRPSLRQNASVPVWLLHASRLEGDQLAAIQRLRIGSRRHRLLLFKKELQRNCDRWPQ